MKSFQSPALLLVYGEGGHAEEMRRLLDNLSDGLFSELSLVAITEAGAKDIHSDIVRHNVTEVRDKQKGIRIFSLFKSLWILFRQLYQVFARNNVRFVITTGPGLAIPVSLYARFKGIQVLHVETCCRFYSKSLTGKFMEKLATDFWVQNEELLSLYPDAKYCGRL